MQKVIKNGYLKTQKYKKKIKQCVLKKRNAEKCSKMMIWTGLYE